LAECYRGEAEELYKRTLTIYAAFGPELTAALVEALWNRKLIDAIKLSTKSPAGKLAALARKPR
jgi:hypothetical protein